MPPSGLHGRTTELAWLRSLWDAATARDASGRFTGGPRMAVIAAETGYGKTRLVQALYQQLTEDPSWDPAEINYWPDAFQAPGEQLRVNPDPEGHVPKGPPQFLWLGMRWQPTDVRNVEERACALPAARDALRIHVEIADRCRPAWQHARAQIERNARRTGLVGSLARAADLAIPFGELGVRLLKGTTDLVRDRSGARRSLGAEQARQQGEAAREFMVEMREVFGGRGSAGRVLPTILWLDDAQWIDGATLGFVQALWREARARSWPLLVAVTHWEREWDELRSSPQGQGLAALEDEPGVEVLKLSVSARRDLAGYMAERLPGLTGEQRELLLDKASGNFLTMVENVGELLANPAAFAGGSCSAALNPEGERFVREWESQRQRRIEQRFGQLTTEIRTVLGWASSIGIRFLRDVVADHAVRSGLVKDANALLDACVVPFAILGSPSANVREFRDRAFHVVARKHFERWGGSQADALRAVLREHLVRWVNAAFDDRGNLVEDDRVETDGRSSKPSAMSLPSVERRDLLGMAVAELGLNPTGDWSDPAQAAALRARMLMAWTDHEERLFGRVRAEVAPLADVDWSRVPTRVAGTDFRLLSAMLWQESGALDAARGLLASAIEAMRRDAVRYPCESADIILCMGLTQLARFERERGRPREALAVAQETATILQRHAGDDGSAESRRDLAAALFEAGSLQLQLGNLPAARGSAERCLAVRIELPNDEEPATVLGLLEAIVLLGRIALASGDAREAEERFRQSLGFARELVDAQDSEDARHAVVESTVWLAEAVAHEDRAAARALLEEALAEARALAGSDEHPELVDDLARILRRIGEAEFSLGDYGKAQERFSEALDIARAACASAPAPYRAAAVIEALRGLSAVAARRRDRSILALADEWLGMHRTAGARMGDAPVPELAAACARASLLEATSGGVLAAARRAETALELLGAREPGEGGPGSVAFGARIVANAVIVTCAHELDGSWPMDFLKEALRLANEMTERSAREPRLTPEWWDAVACCIAYKAAEEHFTARGDTTSAERASARVRRWESVIEDL